MAVLRRWILRRSLLLSEAPRRAAAAAAVQQQLSPVVVVSLLRASSMPAAAAASVGTTCSRRHPEAAGAQVDTSFFKGWTFRSPARCMRTAVAAARGDNGAGMGTSVQNGADGTRSQIHRGARWIGAQRRGIRWRWRRRWDRDAQSWQRPTRNDYRRWCRWWWRQRWLVPVLHAERRHADADAVARFAALPAERERLAAPISFGAARRCARPSGGRRTRGARRRRASGAPATPRPRCARSPVSASRDVVEGVDRAAAGDASRR